jgi:hypothetical protein
MSSSHRGNPDGRGRGASSLGLDPPPPPPPSSSRPSVPVLSRFMNTTQKAAKSAILLTSAMLAPAIC